MRSKKYSILLIVLFLTSILSGTGEARGNGAEQILRNCVQKLSTAKSIRAEFSMTVSGKRMAGTLLSKDSRYNITLPGMSTIYDGKNMWSYSAQNKETTVWTPTKSELTESNPLLYLSQAKDYTVTAGPVGSAGTKTVILTPKKRNTGIKRVLVTINTTTSLPSVIKIESGNGSTLVNIKNLRLNTAVSDASFRYDSKAHKGVQLVDLR